MSQDFSREGLLRFHDYLATKGLMNPNTVAARKAAANKMLAVLDENEAADLRKVELDEISERFFNLNKNDFTPESLVTYKSRLRSAVTDFIKHTENPSAFKTVSSRTRAANQKNDGAPRKPVNGNSNISEEFLSKSNSEITVQIPIREGIVVRFIGVPSDLKKKEAQKIANVILAYATDDD